VRSLTYPRFMLRQHVGFGAFSFVVVGVLQYLIVRLITTEDTATMVRGVIEQLPERMRMIVSEQFITRLTTGGAVAFGFSHPLALALLAINAIQFPARHVAGEIEGGTMEWLLAQPVARLRVVLSVSGAGGVTLLAIVCGAWIGSLSALAGAGALVPDLLFKILGVGFNLWILMVLVMSYTLVLAAFARDGGKVALRAAAVTFVFYLLHVLVPIWDAIAFTRPFNFFTYYQPQKLISGERSITLDVVVLAMVAAVCELIAARRFCRRDIPG